MSTLELPSSTTAGPRQGGDDGLAALAAMVRLGERRFTPAFVWYERPSQRARLIGRLERALPEKRLVAVSLQDPRIDVRERTARFFETLHRIADENADGEGFDAVVLLDWEQRLRPALRDQQPVSTFAGLFNRGRPLLKEAFPCPFLVFVPRDAMAALEERAPDFVSWNSGLFYFPF